MKTSPHSKSVSVRVWDSEKNSLNFSRSGTTKFFQWYAKLNETQGIFTESQKLSLIQI